MERYLAVEAQAGAPSSIRSTVSHSINREALIGLVSHEVLLS